jgi:hypothetical protein
MPVRVIIDDDAVRNLLAVLDGSVGQVEIDGVGAIWNSACSS